MEKVTSDGVITVEESKIAQTEAEVVEGMQFDRGYISPYMVTDTDKMEAVIDDALILITDKKIASIQDLLPLLEQIMHAGGKLIIIAEDIEGEALSTILVNKLRGVFTCVGIKAPGFGDRRKEMLQDIAILTGGKVITSELVLSSRTPRFPISAAHARSRSPRRTPSLLTAQATRTPSSPESTRSAHRSRTPLPTMTERSFRSALQSLQAA